MLIGMLQMGLDLYSGGLTLVLVPKLDTCTEGTCGETPGPCSTNTLGPPIPKLYYVINTCLMNSKVSESVRYMICQTNVNVSQKRELFCIRPGNKERHLEVDLEACSTEHVLYLSQFQVFQ